MMDLGSSSDSLSAESSVINFITVNLTSDWRLTMKFIWGTQMIW